jgi:putative phosphoesterase
MESINPNTRIAILADIHGNSIALDAVLQDIQSSGGVDGYWFLGDYAAIGFDPVGVLERVKDLPAARFLRGNTDRYLTDESLPGPSPQEVQRHPDLLPVYIQVARSFAWTTGAVSAAGWLPWLSGLPLDFRFTLPGGSQVLAVHASPGNDDGAGIHPYLSEMILAEIAAQAQADLLLVGHHHLPFDLSVNRVRIVNPGSVSNPFPPDLRASYILLETSRAGYQITFRRVDYDREAVIYATSQVNHPAFEYISAFMRGQNRPSWLPSNSP